MIYDYDEECVLCHLFSINPLSLMRIHTFNVEIHRNTESDKATINAKSKASSSHMLTTIHVLYFIFIDFINCFES